MGVPSSQQSFSFLWLDFLISIISNQPNLLSNLSINQLEFFGDSH